MAEYVYLRYCYGQFSRVELFFALGYLRRYPQNRCCWELTPRFVSPPGRENILRIVGNVIHYLANVMTEVSAAHYFDQRNVVPAFPLAVGAVDTFPVFAYSAPGHYSGKYKRKEGKERKFQVVVAFTGLITHISHSFPGAKADPNIWRLAGAPVPDGHYVLGDK